MLGAATRVLRLAFSTPEATGAIQTIASAELEFVAYAVDCQVAGSLALTADRLTDLLNGCDEVELVEITWIGTTGEIGEASTARIPRSDLLVVKAGPPRGNPARRHRTRQVPVAAGIGPYVVYGYLHTRPGSDAMIDLGRRDAMIPLTDASIHYESGGIARRDDASTLIVNRDRADWIRPATEREFGGERSPLS